LQPHLFILLAGKPLVLQAAAVIASAAVILIARQFLIQQFGSQLFYDPITLFAIPLAIALATGFRPGRIGLKLGTTVRDLPLTALLLLACSPLIFIASRSPVFYNYYPLFGWARNGLPGLAAYELFILVLMASTEFFFRGFLMFGTKKKLGANASNLLQAAPYVLVHLGKPPLEIPASLVGGLLFGWLDQKSESIAPSIVLHFGFNLLMDIFCLQAAGLLFA